METQEAKQETRKDAGPPYVMLVLQEQDNVLEPDDWGSYVVTLDGDHVVCRVDWVPPITNPALDGDRLGCPRAGWNLADILEWMRYDDTGSHPSLYRVARRAGEKMKWKSFWRMDELQKFCRSHFARSPTIEDKLTSLARWDGWSVTTPDGAVVTNKDIQFTRTWMNNLRIDLFHTFAEELQKLVDENPENLAEAVLDLRARLLTSRGDTIMSFMSSDRDWGDSHILVPGEPVYAMVVRDTKKEPELVISSDKSRLERSARDLVLSDPTKTTEILEGQIL